jgi:hypothetical protein
MFDPNATATVMTALVGRLAAIGEPLGWALLACAAVLAIVCVVPALAPWRRWALTVTTGLLVAGYALLGWFTFALWRAADVVDPATGLSAGHVAVPPWVESDKLYVWAVVVAVMALFVRRHRDEMLPLLGVTVALLTAGAVLIGKPFTEPLPQFLGQYGQYLGEMANGSAQARAQAFQGMAGSMQYYYNAWYMWVHPPLLFISYGAFVVSFAAIVLAIRHRRSRYEDQAYWWAKLGYLPLTLGMLLGFPWAIMSWSGDAWWWSGKVNMSVMMWLLYTAYLHARLYLRRRGMWRWVVAIAIAAFLALVLTYVTTYLVPGAHSVA